VIEIAKIWRLQVALPYTRHRLWRLPDRHITAATHPNHNTTTNHQPPTSTNTATMPMHLAMNHHHTAATTIVTAELDNFH